MNLEFTWAANPSGPQATCVAREVGKNKVCPLACLLMDDGGLDSRTSIDWLREGVTRVDAVLSGSSIGQMDWDRDAWGALITEAQTNVYSLHDEQCAEAIPTRNFLRALVEWMKFVEAGHSSSTVVVDIG